MPTQRPTLRDLIAEELARLDTRRKALAAALVTFDDYSAPVAARFMFDNTPPRKKPGPKPGKAAAKRRAKKLAARKRKGGNKHSRTLRKDLYDAMIQTVRASDKSIDAPAIRKAMKTKGLPTASVAYHLTRAVKLGDVTRNGTGYRAHA